MNAPSEFFVLGLGLGTVFVGLICIIMICKLMSAICSKINEIPVQPAIVAPAAPAPAPAAPAVSEIPNRQAFIAAVSAAIAEEMGTDVSKIRILSVEKI